MFKLSPSICGQVLLSFTVSEFSCNTLLTRINQIHFRCTRFARFSFTHIDFGTMAKDVTSKHNIFVYITVIMFGTGSWVATNGIWVELPVMVPHLNEGWTLPSYLSILIQLANIGPLAVAVSNIIAPGKLKEKPVVFGIISIGTIACFLLAFFWKTSIYLVGAERSIALLILQFMIALVNCTSSVVFFAFYGNFQAAVYNCILYWPRNERPAPRCGSFGTGGRKNDLPKSVPYKHNIQFHELQCATSFCKAKDFCAKFLFLFVCFDVYFRYCIYSFELSQLLQKGICGQQAERHETLRRWQI